jgi:protein SCO1/2
MNRRKNILIVVIAGFLAMAAGFWLASSNNQQSAPVSLQAEQVVGFHGTILPVARQLAVPELGKSDGSDFVTADLTGHWSLLFFGYTRCPDICPTTMSTLAAAKKQSPGPFPQVYFISVDPQRDTVKNLSAYVKYFDKDFIGITGSEKMLGAMALQSSVVFMKMPAESGSENDYLMDHSSALLLINPQAQLVAFINPPHTADSILKALVIITNNE